MATYFRMPGVSADSDEAVLESWTVEQGASVSSGQPIASVETEKAVVEVESEVDAIVHTLLVPDGATVPVGDPIAILLGPDEPASAAEKLLADLGLGGSPAAAPPAGGPAAAASGPDAGFELRTGDGKALDDAVRAAPEEAGPSPEPPPPTPAADARIDVGGQALGTAPAGPPGLVGSPAGAAGNGATPDAAPAGPAAAPDTAAPSDPAGGRQFTSPSARRVARELGVDITTVTGSGPKGRVVRDDVRRAAAAGAAPPTPAATAPAAAAATEVPTAAAPTPTTGAPAAPTTRAPATPEGWTAVPHSRLRKIVASRLQESKQTAPHFYLRRSARVDELLALRAQLNAAQSTRPPRIRISVNDLVVKAAGLALADVPEMNVVWTDEAVLRAPTADVAVAVAGERGLVTPVIRDVGALSLSTLSARIRDAVARANAGKLAPADLEGGTLTVSNLGMYGVEEFDAILNPPQAGILAVGAAVPTPVVSKRGKVKVASVVNLVLSVDHRPVDGTIGARWLARLVELLEDPMQLVV